MTDTPSANPTQRVIDEWNRVLRDSTLPASYHDDLQGHARAVEASRALHYDNRRETRLTLRETEYLMGAIYKLLRVLNDTTSTEKAKDDVLDAYNYCGLLHVALCKRGLTSENGTTTERGRVPSSDSQAGRTRL